MKRVIYIKNGYSIDDKYVLIDEYNGFGIYEKMTPTGYLISQNWLLSNNDDIKLIIDSYNNICKEELLDMIDNYNNTNKFNVKAVMYCGLYHMHPNGKEVK